MLIEQDLLMKLTQEVVVVRGNMINIPFINVINRQVISLIRLCISGVLVDALPVERNGVRIFSISLVHKISIFVQNVPILLFFFAC